MKKRILFFTLMVLFGLQVLSQSLETDSISKNEISKLSFLIGNWQGSGWIVGQDRKKSDFDQIENVRFKLDSTIILVEGLGSSSGQITHNALAIISYNKSEQNYAFHSHMQNGLSATFSAELVDNRFYWYPNQNVRYVIWINEKGQWYETGEYQRDDNWHQFFEMMLERAQ